MGKKEDIRFYVAECGEFNRMGAFYEDLSLDNALLTYKEILNEPSKAALGPEMGCVVYDKEYNEDREVSLITGKLMYLDMIGMVPDNKENPLIFEAIDTIIKKMPELEVIDHDNVLEEMKKNLNAKQSLLEKANDFDKDNDLER